jgi:hypothetical protein
MTTDQRIQWIALPAGAVDEATVRLSVVVAPRLRTDEAATLAPFADFLDWPARVHGASFSVEVGGATIPATVLGEAPDSSLWTALFDAQTPLVPFVFDDYADRPFLSYSVGAVVGALRSLYARVAGAAADDLPAVRSRWGVEPPVRGLLDLFGELREVAREPLHRGVDSPEERARRVGELLEAARTEAAARRAPGTPRGGPLLEPLPADGSLARHFSRALLFHSRAETEPTAMPPDGEHYQKSVDFHQMLAALGDHPWLMRRLGLVVDLGVPAAGVPPATVSGPGELRVRPTWTSASAGSVDVRPATAYTHQVLEGVPRFAAAPRHPDPAAPPDEPPTGMLPLPDTAFSLEQVDVDGAALKTLNLTATLVAVAERPDPDVKPLHEPDQTGIPALRTSGLSLIEAGRADVLQRLFTGQLDANTAIEQDAPVTFFAEDLVRGYRLDVFDTGPGTWHSLHHRTVTATAERFTGPLSPVADEGFFQLSLVGRAAAPGQAPDPDGELYVHENLVTWDGWSLSAPRPGKAISRDPRAPTDQDLATQPTQVPNDPFTAMALSLQVTAAPGTLPRLRFGRAYRMRVRTVDLAGNGPTPAEADRDLAASTTATPALPIAGALDHQRFEPVAAPALVPTRSFGEGASLRRLVVRSNGTLSPNEYAAAAVTDLPAGHPGYVGHEDRHVAAPKAALELVERHGLLDAVIGSDGSPPDSARRAAVAAAYEVARREKGSLKDIHPEDQLELPYLPDPLAVGALFLGLPGTADPLPVRFDADPWYAARPLRLRLVAGAGAPKWDATNRVLTVLLPQAATARIRVCSLFEGDLGLMGILRWCEQELAGEELDRVVQAAKENRCWLLTPWHDVELVHAVQQPLAEPTWLRFEVTRGWDQPSVDLLGEVELDVPSTHKVDLLAEWSETVDDLARPGPETRAGQAAAFDLALDVAAQGRPDVDPQETPYSLRHERVLTFCTARAADVDPPAPRPHHFGDTRYRRVTYRLLATTSFRECFPPQWTERPELLSRPSEPRTVDVPNSAVPAPPAVVYVVPTQGWEQDTDDVVTVRRRRGGGLRVYLDRPWFSSGDGELLGVVIGPPLTSPEAENYPFVTLLGQDPIRAGESLEFATKATFRGTTLVTDPIEPLEMHRRVTIAAYTPTYDAENRRWFCDLELETGGTYMPFIRLALVRYQPQSLPGRALSHIVLVDIIQTLPDRTLTVRRTGDQLQVTVAGPTYSAIRGIGESRSDDAVLAAVTARLEERDPGIPDDLLSWRAVDGSEVVLHRSLDGIRATWTGTLMLPAAGVERRLTVVEWDKLPVDEPMGGQDGVGARVVYSDILGV